MNIGTDKSNLRRLYALSLLPMLTLAGIVLWSSACRASTESRLAMAVRHRDLAIVKTLLKDGADVNARDEGVEQTPLMSAALCGDVQIAEALLNHGADVNAQDDEGNTPLMLAADRGAAGVVEVLLRHGAAWDRRNAAGATALSLARRKGHLVIARRIEQAANGREISRTARLASRA